MSIEDESYAVDGATRGFGIMGAGMLGAVAGGLIESELSTQLPMPEVSPVFAGAALGLVGATAYNVWDVIKLNHPELSKKISKEARDIFIYPFGVASAASMIEFTLSEYSTSPSLEVALTGAAVGMGLYIGGKIEKVLS